MKLAWVLFITLFLAGLVVSPASAATLDFPNLTVMAEQDVANAYRIHDGVNTSYWESTSLPTIVQLDFGSDGAQIVSNYTINGGSQPGGYYIQGWELYGGNDNTSLSTMYLLDKRLNQYTYMTTQKYEWFTQSQNISEYRYYVLKVTAGTGDTADIAEWRLGESGVPSTFEYYTSNIATSSYENSNVPGYAIDNNTATYWISKYAAYPLPANPQFLSLDFNPQYSPRITNYTIRARSDVGQSGPGTFTFFGSNDNTTFTMLDYRTGVTWSNGEVKIYDTFTEMANESNYRYYRLYITAAGSGDSYTSIAEWHLYGTETSITADFTSNQTTGAEPLHVEFADASTSVGANIDAWNWSFADGSVSSLQNPTHIFSNDGTYPVNLTITNTTFGLVSIRIRNITVTKVPVCDFSSFNTEGSAPFTTYLYDLSTNLNDGPYIYYWDLGDGNTSTSQNLYFTWNNTGTYDVKHCVTDSVTTACNNKTEYVTVGTPPHPVVAPVASFYGGPQLGPPPLNVFFTDVSNNTPTSWLWEFGDGTNSTSQNPTKWYNQSGFFTVNLTATNSAGSNKTSQQNFIMVY